VFQLDLRVLDPLDSPVVRESVTPVSEWALELGSDENGISKSVPISNVSGVVVGGLPGSGKTAWLTQTLAAFASCDAVQMIVIDGKGGMDLNALSSRSFQFVNDDMDLDAVVAVLHDVKEVIRERLQNLHSLFGTSNFWNHGPTPEVPVVFVLIDECQTFLDSRQLIGKELKAKGAEIHSLVNFLVRKGRSAGIVTILSTQKPTADSLPTDIRDNSSVRICFGVQSRYAAEAVLGDEWSSDSAASPLGAAVGVGVASVEGTFVRFRAPYVHEAAVSEWVGRYAGLRGDPAQLLHNGLAQSS
jgi:DNA segregation ATPase FtsK/SpoIIIE-like protein